ncbi:hypothetical protein IJ182_08585 [bacterium]|nr:hypothetical protein [bacterium]
MPIGLVSSPAHVLTNKKVEDKIGCLTDIAKQNLKDTAKVAGLSAAAAGSAALATAVTPQGAKFVKTAQKGIEGLIRKVKINDKSLMAKIQNSDIYGQFNSLPAPAKAAIAAGVAALAVILPIASLNAAGNAGKIEGNYEVNA